MGKKRRAEVDLDAERTLYTSFVAAANSMSHLYSQALQQQRRTSAAASRATLERVLGFLVRNCGASESVPKQALLQFLQQEYESLDGSEQQPHTFPVAFLPTPGAAPGLDDQQQSPEPVVAPSLGKPPTAHHRGLGAGLGLHGLVSPGGKRANSASAMDTTDVQAGVMDASGGQGYGTGLASEGQSKLFVHGTGFGAC